jgi:ribosomal-protein-alanine N-acetyltransferase
MAAVQFVESAEFRPMTAEHLDQVIEIEHRAYLHPWTKGIFKDCLRVGYSCWVCGGSEDIYGYGVLSVAVGEAHVLNVCVDPKYQNQGIGRRLLIQMIDVARRRNADTVLLEVRPSNRGAIKLYESMGFNEVGVRRGYYPDGDSREDALILARAV